MTQEINSINSTNNTTKLQELPTILVDKKLFESLEKGTSISKTIKTKQSKAGMRRAKADVQNQSNIKEILTSKKEVNQELIDILNKYGNNEFRVDTLSYAIYKKDYGAALTLLEHGYDPNKIKHIKAWCHIKDLRKDYYFTPIDFLFVDEIKGGIEGGEFVIPLHDFARLKKGKITFRLLVDLPPEEMEQVKQLLSVLIEKMQIGQTCLKGDIPEIGKEGVLGSSKHIDLSSELIKLQWNEILKQSISKMIYPDLTELAKKAISLKNDDFFDYLINNKGNGCKKLSLESVLNFAIGGLNNEYILKLLEHGACPNIKGDDGKRPIDYVQKLPESDKKREILIILFNYGAQL